MHLFDIVYVLTLKELKIRYKHHAFGYIWSLGNPLAYALLYFMIFHYVMKVKVDNFPVFLISGLFPWQWFANSINVAPTTYMDNSTLIKKVKFPRHILNLVIVLQDMVHYIASIPIIIIAMAIFDIYPTFNWIFGVPIFLFIQLIMCYSFNLLISTMNLFFRDIGKLVQMSLTFVFYSTPVLYHVDMLPPEFKDLLHLNPCSSVVLGWKDLFLKGSINFEFAGIGLLWSLVLLAIARFVYKKLSWRFAEIL